MKEKLAPLPAAKRQPTIPDVIDEFGRLTEQIAGFGPTLKRHKQLRAVIVS